MFFNYLKFNIHKKENYRNEKQLEKYQNMDWLEKGLAWIDRFVPFCETCSKNNNIFQACIQKLSSSQNS